MDVVVYSVAAARSVRYAYPFEPVVPCVLLPPDYQ